MRRKGRAKRSCYTEPVTEIAFKKKPSEVQKCSLLRTTRTRFYFEKKEVMANI